MYDSVVTKTVSFCGEPEPIADATSNSTGTGHYEENTVIRYKCNPGYRIIGNMFSVCEGGKWSQGSFTCSRIVCKGLEIPDHGQIVGSYSREIGGRVNFTCNAGYDLIGDKSLICRADGEWRPAQPPKCEPKYCGEFGSVENAKISQSSADGQRNIYGSVIEVTCETGFILVGKARATCSANGQWDSKPSCRPSVCPQHPGLSSSCIDTVDLDNDMLALLCKENSLNVSVTEVKPLTATCMDDEWDNLYSACYCDCKIDTRDSSLTATNLVNGFLKHDDNLQWSCNLNTFKSTEEPVRCTDGTLSQIPRCMTVGTTRPPKLNDVSTGVMSSSTETQSLIVRTAEVTTDSLITDLTSKSTTDHHESTPESTIDDQDSPQNSTTDDHDFPSKSTVKSNDQKSKGAKLHIAFLLQTVLNVICTVLSILIVP